MRQNPDVRPTYETTAWFNRVLNIVHRHAPDAKIILVREPADALPAIERVLGPPSRDAQTAAPLLDAATNTAGGSATPQR